MFKRSIAEEVNETRLTCSMVKTPPEKTLPSDNWKSNTQSNDQRISHK